jgi:hypothetical protein
MELELEVHLRRLAGLAADDRRGPFGTRAFFAVTDGRVKGDRISGTLVGGRGDWLLIGSDGWGHVDVRARIQTVDGASLYLSYPRSLGADREGDGRDPDDG